LSDGDRSNLQGNTLTKYRNYAIFLVLLNACHQRVIYQEQAGVSPIVGWLRTLNATNPKAFDKCRAAIARLTLLGHELRRPEADYLRDDIYELHVRLGSINYRLLYFFHGRTVSVIAHGLTKEAAVPAAEIKQAIIRKIAFSTNPVAHTYKGEINDV
jgi:hypothetical protein